MQFSDLRMRSAFLAGVAVAAGDVPAPDWPTLVNQAYSDLSWDTEFNEEEVTVSTVSNQAEYTITGAYFKAIKECAYVPASGSGAIRLTHSSENEEKQRDPLWFTRTGTSSPSRFLTPRPNVLRLIDKPNVSGDSVTVRGTRGVGALVNDTDLPAIPDTFHEAIALRAATLYALPLVEMDGMPRLEIYREQYQGFVAAIKQWMGGQRYSGMRRQVQRGYRGRTPLQGYGNY